MSLVAIDPADAPAAAEPTGSKPAFIGTHRWRMRRIHGDRFGALCRIVPQDYSKRPGWKPGHAQPWGKVSVEFADGTVIETQRTSIRPVGFFANRGPTGRPRKDGGG